MIDEELLKVIEEAKEKGETRLDLSNNKLTTLPLEIGTLRNLTEFDLSNNQLKKLPITLFQLPNLTTLDLGFNHLTNLPSGIFRLSNLEVLSLSGNKIKYLPPEVLQLIRLKELYLWGNHLSELPSEITQLIKLEILDLSFNKLTKVPPELFSLPRVTQITLSNNPLITPPLAIVDQGIEAIRDYLKPLEEDQPLNEAKLLLIGEGSAGKTSLAKCIMGLSFEPEEDTTHGISIKEWGFQAENKTIKTNIWDFGGQEIMHATHQFFLSNRSLYVLVLDGRRDERPEYWLHHIETFGGDSPVLIVLNKHDNNPSFDLNRPFLQQKYPNIKGFFRTSCKSGKGVARFRKALIKELARLPMIETLWSDTWFRVKLYLEASNQPYISWDRYETICTNAGITEEDSQELLINCLHDLGVAIHFREFELEDTHILDPKWVTEGVYKIITSEEVAAYGGILQLIRLKKLLKQRKIGDYSYPRQKHNYIIDLMKKFELCYSLDKKRILIPQLLGVVEPQFSFEKSTALRFVLHYPHFLPPAIMPRFLVKVHQDIKNNLRWRTGVVLENEEFGATALIRADNEARRINIFVHGTRRREYLHFLWYSFWEINNSFKNLNVRELVPMPDAPEVMARYTTLLKYAEKGMDEYLPDDSDKIYSVKELLGLIQPTRKDQVRDTEETSGDKESWTEMLNSFVEPKVTLLGVTINMNEGFDRLLAWNKRKRTRNR